MATLFDTSTGRGRDANDVFVSTLRNIRLHGDLVDSTTGGGPYQELLGYRAELTDPRRRILVHPSRRLNAVGAVARLVWMLAGNDRLEDIAFYEPKVRRFTDDGLVVPGSSYGARLFHPRPGLNQVSGIISRLQHEPASRRACGVIWSPEDAVRPSNDIPCAFGVFFHIRNGSLVATTTMRSNNAHLLLPYNIFEFSMLAELIARELDVEFGSYVQWAASMHIFKGDFAASDEAISKGTGGYQGAMDMMPKDPSPVQQASEFAQAEARIRMAPSAAEAVRIFGSAEGVLHPYWGDLLRVLLIHKLGQSGDHHSAREMIGYLPQPFKTIMVPEAAPATQMSIIDVEQRPDIPADVLDALSADIDFRLLDRHLDRVVSVYEQAHSLTITGSQWLAMQEHFRNQAEGLLAARSPVGGSSADRYLPHTDEVVDLLRSLQGTHKTGD